MCSQSDDSVQFITGGSTSTSSCHNLCVPTVITTLMTVYAFIYKLQLSNRSISAESTSKLSMENACFHSGHNILTSCQLSNKIGIHRLSKSVLHATSRMPLLY
jgi:hypothetical protein